MRKQTLRQLSLVAVLALVLSLGAGGRVTAEQEESSSPHYSVSEVQIGGNGSALDDCSRDYCATESLGDTVDGQASSATYRAEFGSFPTDSPVLAVTVTGGTQNMGQLTTSGTGTAVDEIKVESYLSDGYALLIAGAPPSQGEHTLKAMASGCPCTSQPGAEQFGINLAANTSPSIGSNPVQVPSSAFSFGSATTNYDQSDLFYYSNGDEIADSSKQTGETDYTLSMIINISNVTPGGQYSGQYSAIAVPQY